MTNRRGRTVLEVSDVMPTTLRTDNRDALLSRCREYRHFWTDSLNYLLHSGSTVGSFTILVKQIEAAGTDVDVRRAWTALENWADDWGVTVT